MTPLDWIIITKDDPMTDTVYVVIAECGEYSDRNDWVAAVFSDKSKAEAEVLAWSKARAIYEAEVEFWEQRERNLRKADPMYAEAHKNTAWPKYHQLAGEKIGPYPEFPGERFDRLYFVEVPLNVWGKYEF